VRLHELARLLPAAKKIGVWGGKALAQGIFQIALSLLIAFFFYRDGHAAANQIHASLHQIAGERGDRLLELAGSTIRAVVYGVLGTALLQGVVAAIGFAVAGVPGAVSLGFVTFVLSFLPGGPPIVAAPAAFWLYREGSTAWAVFMIAWGVMVGALDNVVKPLLVSRGGSTPMILVMLGVLGGALAFGVIGMFLGPKEHVEGQPTHRGGSIELLGNRHKRHALRVEDLDHLCEVGQRSGQPVDFVHDHDIDQAMAYVFEQPLQGRPLHVPAGETAIIVGGLDQSPAFALLALDEGLAGFALCMQRIEVLLETLF
jgi:hypothetical protein